MAVATSSRRSKLHFLTVLAGHIRGELGGVRLIPSAGFLAKIQSDSLEPPDTFVPDLKAFFGGRGRQTLVPCTGIRWYVDRTKSIRTGHKRLFVSTVPPFRPASRDTIACWIVTAICLVPCGWPAAVGPVHAREMRGCIPHGFSLKPHEGYHKGGFLEEPLHVLRLLPEGRSAGGWKSRSSRVAGGQPSCEA